MSTSTSTTFTAPVLTWRVSTRNKPRQWVVLTMSYGEAIKWFEVKPYNCKTHEGEQRHQKPSWVRHLRRAMEDDTYVPTGWKAGFRRWHKDRAVLNDDGTITVPVELKKPFAHLDGGHRARAAKDLLAIYRGKLEQEGLSEEEAEQLRQDIACVESSHVEVAVYFDHEKHKDNFAAFQKSKPVGNDLKTAMERRGGRNQEEKIAIGLMEALAKNTKSHLFNLITRDEATSTTLGEYALTKSEPSELSCNLYGGAKIAHNAGKDVAWLEKIYVDAWQGIREFTDFDQQDGEDVPAVLMEGKILCPLGSVYGGKKGGTTLLIGLANMLAYRMAFFDRKEANEKDLGWLAEVVDAVCDEPRGGGLDAPKKRRLMGAFARMFFADIVLSPGEKPHMGKVNGRDGVPIPLLNLIPASAFGLQKRAKVALSVQEDDEEGEDGDGGLNGVVVRRVSQA